MVRRQTSKSRKKKRVSPRKSTQAPPRSLFWAKLGLLVVSVTLIAGTAFLLVIYVKVGKLIDLKLDGQDISPKVVYARPIEFTVGQMLSPDQLERQLDQGTRNGSLHQLGKSSFKLTPSDESSYDLELKPDQVGTWRLVSIRTGRQKVDSVATRAPRLTNLSGPERVKRHDVRFQEIPDQLRNAILAAEDDRFFFHRGFDFSGILRAAWINLIRMDKQQGGSTITQQFVKNYFLSAQKSLRRKVEELVLAAILEERYSKAEIFELYANHVYMGQVGSFALSGLGQASLSYFGKEISSLDLGESSLLAAIIKAPNAYSPHRNLKRAIRRRNLVLDLMEKKGFITVQENARARTKTLKVSSPSRQDGSEAPYFIDHLQRELDGTLWETLRSALPIKIFTTLDLGLQRAALSAIATGLREIDDKVSQEPTQVALLAVSATSGDILAMVGGRDYAESQFNRATHALRQPGSAFKPFVYAAGLEGWGSARSEPMTLITQYRDEPYEVRFQGQSYRPKNYGDHYSGEMVNLREALSQSLNTPTLKLAESIGFKNIAQFAESVGLGAKIPAYPSLSLGAFDTTLFQLTQAYTLFPNQGSLVELHSIQAVTVGPDRVDVQPPIRRDLIRPQTAFLVTSVLESVLDEGTGRGARLGGFRMPAAGKTGTSRDSWFVGYTPELLVGVWVGKDDGTDLHLTGSEAALKIWSHFMQSAQSTGRLSGIAFIPPDGITKRPLAKALRPGQERSFEYFILGTEPDAPPSRQSETHRTSQENRKKSRFWGWIKRVVPH